MVFYNPDNFKVFKGGIDMQSSTLAIIIIVLTIISFVLEKIPLAMTAMISALVMGLFIPEMPLSAIYAGFSSTTVMMVAGMMIVGDSLFQTGMANKIGNALIRSPIAKNERLFVVSVVALCTLLSAFLSNSGTIAMMMPLIGAAALRSKGVIRNKMVVMAAGIGCAIGGGATLVGSTSQLTANGILQKTAGYEEGIQLFDMTKGMAPLCLIMLLYFATVGYSIMKKVFKPELGDDSFNVAAQSSSNLNEVPAWKGYLSLGTLILCVVGFVLTGYQPFKSWFNVGVIGLVGGTILITSGCMPLKPTLRDLDWNTLVILAAAQGFAKGLDVSGGGKVIATFVLELFGGPKASFVALMIAGLLVITVLTQFMSNTALAAMMTPIYIAIALQMGISPVPFVIMVACATNIACSTPVGTPCVTQTLPAGYSYMDYVKVGGPLFIILVIAACFIFPVVYPMTPLH